MLDTTDDIAEGISFQAFEDDCRLLATLLHDVLLRELGPRFIHILERNRILAQVPPIRRRIAVDHALRLAVRHRIYRSISSPLAPALHWLHSMYVN